MINRWIIITLSLMIGSITLQGVAFAHGTEQHGKISAADVQMKKLHDMMPIFSSASAGLESSLEKGDAVATKNQADRILAAVPDLKKSRPHKNVRQIAVFKAIAGKMGDDIEKIDRLTKKGNFTEAKVAFKKMEARCAECHAKFRD